MKALQGRDVEQPAGEDGSAENRNACAAQLRHLVRPARQRGGDIRGEGRLLHLRSDVSEAQLGRPLSIRHLGHRRRHASHYTHLWGYRIGRGYMNEAALHSSALFFDGARPADFSLTLARTKLGLGCRWISSGEGTVAAVPGLSFARGVITDAPAGPLAGHASSFAR